MMVWEFIFLMLILKIPVIYLCLVVYWAIRGERGPAEAARLVTRPDIEPRPPPRRPAPIPRRARPGRPGRPPPARARTPPPPAAPPGSPDELRPAHERPACRAREHRRHRVRLPVRDRDFRGAVLARLPAH